MSPASGSMKDAMSYEDLRDSYLQCRTYGHAWHETKSPRPPESHGWWLELRCSRCHTHRESFINGNTGESQGNRYKYPKHYELDEKVTRSQFRQVLASRRNYDFVKEARKKRDKK